MELSPIVQTNTVPLVQNYQCYRLFMRDRYRQKKTERNGFSFRRFSQLVGLKSPNYLQMVMDGTRNLSENLAPKVGQVLGLKGAEKDYFVALVKKANAQEPGEVENAIRGMTIALKKMVSKEIPKAQQEVFQHWSYLLIREMVFLKDFKPDGILISKQLRGLISPEEAEKALRLLLKTGFLTVNERGDYKVSEPVIDTGDSLTDVRILNGHLELFKAWTQILPSIASTERELGFLNCPVSKEKIPELKARIRRFQDELIGWLQEEKNPDLIVQVGTYMVPMTVKP